VKFDSPGEVRLEHRTPDQVYDLGAFSVAGNATGSAGALFDALRVDPQLTSEHELIGDDLERSPDKVLAFVATMPLLYGDDVAPATSYACPMHSEITSSEPGTCPKCGMQLLPVRSEKPTVISYTCPMHPEVISSEPGTCPKCGMKLVPSDTLPAPDEDAVHHGHEEHGEQNDGLEWEDLMPEINRASEPGNMRWMLIDRESGAENGAITWAFTVGDRVKIRLVNEMESDHPMHHPFHVHGAGRFLVLSREGEAESNLVWKDTVLVPAGRTVDILLDVSNPGLWMAHCHIAEHAQSGMMFSFNVSRRDPAGAST
jgi:FtsP/CotA-like multicopper oxidase with cupredoxin domain